MFINFINMYIVDFDDIWIIELNNQNKYKYEDYEQYETFDDAKKELVDYWEFAGIKAKQGLKDAKKIKLS